MANERRSLSYVSLPFKYPYVSSGRTREAEHEIFIRIDIDFECLMLMYSSKSMNKEPQLKYAVDNYSY